MVYIFIICCTVLEHLLAQSKVVLYLPFIPVMPGAETPRKCSDIDSKKQAFGKITPMIYCSTTYYFY